MSIEDQGTQWPYIQMSNSRCQRGAIAISDLPSKNGLVKMSVMSESMYRMSVGQGFVCSWTQNNMCVLLEEGAILV